MENYEGQERQIVVHKQSKGKQFVSTVTGGIIGSVLTLAVITSPYSSQVLDRLNINIGNETQQTAKTETTNVATKTTPVTAKKTNNSQSSSISDMVASASQSIVGVSNIQQSSNRFSQQVQEVESGTGSGVIFKKDGNKAYIVTNNHVIEGASQVEITLADGEKTSAKIIGADALTDLAVLEIDGKYVSSVLSFGDSSTLRAGDEVVAIGNPLGLDLSGTVTQGIVSGTDRSMAVSTSSGEWDLNVIQTDAAINPGNSGGALLNTEGLVIGINSLKISEDGVEGLGFAIPSNDVIPIVNELIEKGEISRPYLGVSLADLEQIPAQYLQDLPENINYGTMVTNVDSSSNAGKAGLEVQDVIVSFNGTKVEGASDLRKILYTDVKVGDKVKLEVYRNGELKTFTVTLAK
ncbi:S1C family serine protease [Bacillus sp. T3]|uniref:S1C family serine protease n=1 Tax=Bacillus sp. T3 TaxID=467262 RepID=UPI002980D538|nr:trypsin-like peptidase domain-containing protein [Bacillus sp. T3]